MSWGKKQKHPRRWTCWMLFKTTWFGVCVIAMEDGLESGLFCQESGVGWAVCRGVGVSGCRGLELVHRCWGWGGGLGSFPTPAWSQCWAGLLGICVCVCVGLGGDVGLGLHCHTVHTVYAYQATVSASLSRKCLLEFILGEFHMTGTGISINYGIERFV